MLVECVCTASAIRVLSTDCVVHSAVSHVHGGEFSVRLRGAALLACGKKLRATVRVYSLKLYESSHVRCRVAGG